MIFRNLADLYGRNSDYAYNREDFANFFPSHGGYNAAERRDYEYERWSVWDYVYIRDLNVFIDRVGKADVIEVNLRNRFLAEARFIRALVYFRHVIRMGGVPLITEPLEYDFSGDPSYLQFPRAKEKEIYDFIISELDAVKGDLPDDPSLKSRATWGAAVAYKSRAALYAGSIAKYGQTTPTVSTTGGEVGIGAGEASGYYQTALAAAEDLITSGGEYGLYNEFPGDPEKNFFSLFNDNSGNSEAIFVRDYLAEVQGNRWTMEMQPSGTQVGSSWPSNLSPTITLVQSFEKLDNTFEPLQNKDGSGNYIVYDNLGEIFANRDHRLAASVLLPSGEFRGIPVDIWAGWMDLNDGTIYTGSLRGEVQDLPGVGPVQVVGLDGPIETVQRTAHTGFLIRKYLDPAPESGSDGILSGLWEMQIRYAEVLLNAAEAAFELGDASKAAGYMNQVRQRAGFVQDLDVSEITFDRIVHERYVEFIAEKHDLWDMKRWRLAHKSWNGESMTESGVISNIGDPEKVLTEFWGLWPYKVYDPGNPDHGKWIFDIHKISWSIASHNFRLGNYYSKISDDVISANPKIIKNPNQ